MVAERTKHFRTQRGWNQPELAERMRKAGHKGWNRSIVANLESGRRATVTIDEVFSLAHVLDVPPLMLVIPLGIDEKFYVTPAVTFDTEHVFYWAKGEIARLDRSAADMTAALSWTNANAAPAAYASYGRALRLLDEAESFLTTAQDVFDKAVYENEEDKKRDLAVYKDKAVGHIQDALQSIAGALNDMVDAGILTPVVGSDLFRRLTEAKLLKEPSRVRTRPQASTSRSDEGAPTDG